MGEIIKTTLLGDPQWKQLKVRHTSLSAIRTLPDYRRKALPSMLKASSQTKLASSSGCSALPKTVCYSYLCSRKQKFVQTERFHRF
jgi:hypothetical protein